MSEVEEAISKYIQNVDDNWNYITPKDLNKRILDNDVEDLFLLDIRKPEDYIKGHIPGSTNIFWLDLFKPESLEKLPKDKTIVLICYVGHTASQSMAFLELLGYDVVVLKFGMGISPVEEIPISGWSEMGFDLELGESKMEDLKFASEEEAIQFLSDKLNAKIIIAAEEEKEGKEKIKGGLADGRTIQSIANSHGVSPKDIQKQIAKGLSVEMEHTEDPEVAKEIVMDHLAESPIYYDLLEEMENKMEEDKPAEEDKE
jgi:rhodanese-related sulfurtransferase